MCYLSLPLPADERDQRVELNEIHHIDMMSPAPGDAQVVLVDGLDGWSNWKVGLYETQTPTEFKFQRSSNQGYISVSSGDSYTTAVIIDGGYWLAGFRNAHTNARFKVPTSG